MIRSALQTSYIRACLNTSRNPTKKLFMTTPVKTFVTSVAIPKVNYLPKLLYLCCTKTSYISLRTSPCSKNLPSSTTNGPTKMLPRPSLSMVRMMYYSC
jgi:hypothetical protein